MLLWSFLCLFVLLYPPLVVGGETTLGQNARPRAVHLKPRKSCMEHYQFVSGGGIQQMQNGIYPIQSRPGGHVYFVNCEIDAKEHRVTTVIHNSMRPANYDPNNENNFSPIYSFPSESYANEETVKIAYQLPTTMVEEVINYTNGLGCDQLVLVNDSGSRTTVADYMSFLNNDGTLRPLETVSGTLRLQGRDAGVSAIKPRRPTASSASSFLYGLGPLRCSQTPDKDCVFGFENVRAELKLRLDRGEQIEYSFRTGLPHDAGAAQKHLLFRLVKSKSFVDVTVERGYIIELNDSTTQSIETATSRSLLGDRRWRRFAFTANKTHYQLTIDGSVIEFPSSFHFDHILFTKLRGADIQFVLIAGQHVCKNRNVGKYNEKPKEGPVVNHDDERNKCLNGLATVEKACIESSRDKLSVTDVHASVKTNTEDNTRKIMTVPGFIEVFPDRSINESFAFTFRSSQTSGLLLWSYDYKSKAPLRRLWETSYLQVYFTTVSDSITSTREKQIHLSFCSSSASKGCERCSLTCAECLNEHNDIIVGVEIGPRLGVNRDIPIRLVVDGSVCQIETTTNTDHHSEVILIPPDDDDKSSHTQKTSRTYMTGVPRVLCDRSVLMPSHNDFCVEAGDKVKEFSGCVSGSVYFDGSTENLRPQVDRQHTYYYNRSMVTMSDWPIKLNKCNSPSLTLSRRVARFSRRTKRDVEVRKCGQPTVDHTGITPPCWCPENYYGGRQCNKDQQPFYLTKKTESQGSTDTALKLAGQSVVSFWILFQLPQDDVSKARPKDYSLSFSWKQDGKMRRNCSKFLFDFKGHTPLLHITGMNGSSSAVENLMQDRQPIPLMDKDARLHYLIVRDEDDAPTKRLTVTVDGIVHELNRKLLTGPENDIRFPTSIDANWEANINSINDDIVLWDFGFKMRKKDSTIEEEYSYKTLNIRKVLERKIRLLTPMQKQSLKAIFDNSVLVASSIAARGGGPFYVPSAYGGGAVTDNGITDPEGLKGGLVWWHILLLVLACLLVLLLCSCLVFMLVGRRRDNRRNVNEERTTAAHSKELTALKPHTSDIKEYDSEPQVRQTPPLIMKRSVPAYSVQHTRPVASIVRKNDASPVYAHPPTAPHASKSEVSGAFAEMHLQNQEPKLAKIARLSEFIEDSDNNTARR